MYDLVILGKILLVILILWTIPWKVYGVWTAAKRDDKKWFVALVFLNTAGILEIIYIFKFAKKTWDEVKKDFHHGWMLF